VGALKLVPRPESSQATDALRHWADRRRELLRDQQLDRLITVLERLVAVLERRAA